MRIREVACDPAILQNGLDRRGDPERFLTLDPGRRVRAFYDDAILEDEPLDASPEAASREVFS